MTIRAIAVTALFATLGHSAVQISAWSLGAAESQARAGTTYFVSVTGDDAGVGSDVSPLRSIQSCVDRAQPGDTCVVTRGTYTEQVQFRRSGTVSAPITLSSQITYAAVLVGTVLSSFDNTHVNGFTLSLPSGSRWGIQLNGSHSAAVDNHITTTSSALGLNNIGLHVRGTYNSVIANRVDSVCFGISLEGHMNAAVGNDVSRLRLNGSCGDVDYLRFVGTSITVKGNRFYGIDLGSVGSAHVDCMQTFDNSGVVSHDVLLDGNYCRDAHQGVIITATTIGKSSDVVVRNNVISQVTSWCLMNSDVKNVLVVNNTCDAAGGLYGLFCRGNASCEFKNNVVYGSSSRRLYGTIEDAVLIDGDERAPGRNNLLFVPGEIIAGYSNDLINVDPRFVGRNTGNYVLGQDSPAIDAGVYLDRWLAPEDAVGVARPQGRAWDIGAYEWAPLAPQRPSGLRVAPQ